MCVCIYIPSVIASCASRHASASCPAGTPNSKATAKSDSPPCAILLYIYNCIYTYMHIGRSIDR